MVSKKTIVTKDTKIVDIIKNNPKTIEIMIKYGLYCATCPVAFMETLEQGAKAHGLDDKMIEKMIKDINGLKK